MLRARPILLVFSLFCLIVSLCLFCYAYPEEINSLATGIALAIPILIFIGVGIYQFLKGKTKDGKWVLKKALIPISVFVGVYYIFPMYKLEWALFFHYCIIAGFSWSLINKLDFFSKKDRDTTVTVVVIIGVLAILGYFVVRPYLRDLQPRDNRPWYEQIKHTPTPKR